MRKDVKEFCKEIYSQTFSDTMDALSHSSKAGKEADRERQAQKEAIKYSIIRGLKVFPDIDAAEIWKTIYEIHVHRKSGIDDSLTIRNVISADQSWKKSSGHAFEEMVKMLSNEALKDTPIRILLQRDLNTKIKADEISNEPRDISWLKEQIKGDVFDLYATVSIKEKTYCFGCIQCKTSIRDRVTRDREPSLHAMQSFFWSIAVVLDGDFLKLPKFISMVNGGSKEHPINGWHGMYVFTDEKTEGRIFHIDVNMDTLKRHAIQAAEQWTTQRQWFNESWMPSLSE